MEGLRIPLSLLLIPSEGQYKLTSDPKVMHPALCQVNKKSLQASVTSSFVTGPLSIIGKDGFNESSADILNGRYSFTLNDDVLQTLIYHLQRTCPPLKMNFKDTKENIKRFTEAIIATPEKTSSSPSGIHYGIYQTILKDEYLTTVLAKLASIPFQYGFVLQRWTQVTQVMIKKKPEPYIDKLRIIELFEGDYVAIVKSIMRALMSHLWENGERRLGTYATETGGSTHLAIISRVWAYNLARIKRCPIATLDNDSIGCYDRMAPPLLSLLLRRGGMPDELTRTFIHQLLFRQRRVHTAYGLSEMMAVDDDEYIGGIGQGKPGGPTCYHLQLLPLLLVMRDMTPGFTALDPTRTISYQQHVASYVDDCNSLIGLLPQEQRLSIPQQTMVMTDRAQLTLSTWVRLIRITSGDIKPSNRFWTFCSQWEERYGRLIPRTPTQAPEILIDEIPYPMKPPETCERYLGVRVGISGSMDEEFKHRHALSKLFAAAGYTLTFREEAAIAYQAYYLAKFGYPLPVTTFNLTHVKRIESPSIQAILIKLGYIQHFPRCVVFGPIEWGGLGLQSLQFIQGYQQTKLMLRVLNYYDILQWNQARLYYFIPTTRRSNVSYPTSHRHGLHQYSFSSPNTL